jgi:site-specific DNA recombinase
MAKKTDGLPVAIYARYSTERQDARSIDDQMRRCRVHAANNGYRVVAEFSDAAISGAHVERADMQRLLAAARSKGGGPFRAVLVDDLSRLSRDLGNTWQIVFHDLASADVKVVDVTTGMSSDGAGARLTFGAMALVNDTFLQLVRAETHRGLEGRAIGGFSTGGRCYGFATVQEENPPDLEHPRRRAIVDPREAATVRRVFELFADGMALKKIAGLLNQEGLAAPNDGGRGNKIGRGWGHTTIRAMLRNERYLGRIVWNQSKWVRVSGRKSRRRVDRPESDWVTHEYPELALVPKELWDAAQARFERVYSKARGRPAGTGRHVHLVSGLMRCGACGGSMTVVGRKSKGGVSYARFGCTAHYSRGAAICANGLSISEKKASRTLVNALKAKLDHPEAIERFLATFKQRAAALRSQNAVGSADPVQVLRDCERRVANLTEALAKVGWSEAIASKLSGEEAELGRLKAERATAAKDAAPRVLPHPSAIDAYRRSMFTLLETDPARGRELLSRFVAPVVMTPDVEGPVRRYRATGAFNLSFFLTAAAASESRSGKSSCAGRI